MRVVVSPQNSGRSDKWGSLVTLNLSFEQIGSLVFSAVRISLPVQGTHVVNEDAALTRRLTSGLLSTRFVGRHFGNSQPCLCVGVVGSGTVHLFRVLSEFQTEALSHFLIASLSLSPQLVPVLGKMLCPFQWAPAEHTHAMLFLVQLLHFRGTWIYSCISRRPSSPLWLHGLLIELQVDGVLRECEGFIKVISNEAIFFW